MTKKIDVKSLSEKELQELLVSKKKYDKIKEQRRKYTERRQVKIKLLMEKCKKMNIVVTDEEIDEYIRTHKKS